MTVLIAGNTFTDTGDIIVLRGVHLFSVVADPLSLTVVTPADLPSGRSINVIGGVIQGESRDVTVVSGGATSSVFWGSHLVALAAKDADAIIRAHFDFRIVGINVFADATGLHVGGMHIAGSSFGGGGAAFNLG